MEIDIILMGRKRIMVFEREENRNVCSVANGWLRRSITAVTFNATDSMLCSNYLSFFFLKEIYESYEQHLRKFWNRAQASC